MGRRDHEDAVARALDLLPDGDPAKSDPRMLRDAALAEEARLARETAADVWLAVSPLRAAPPEALDEVMAKTDAPARAGGRRSRGMIWLTAGGWAAAVALAVAWWSSKEAPGEIATKGENAAPQPVAPVHRPGEAIPPRPEAVQRSPETERRLRDEIARLRDALAAERGPNDAFRPQVIRLKSPAAEHRSPEEDRERLHTILSHALLTALEIESGAPDDPASIVIERGWLPQAFAVQEDDLVRHRNFPEDSWGELGLLKSDEGGYYDPEAGLVWSADEGGRGFVGRRATAEDDLSVYRQPEPGDTTAIAANKAGPEGFVISDPATGQTQAVLRGLTAPAEGFGQWLVFSDASGVTREVSLTSSDYGFRGLSDGGSIIVPSSVFSGHYDNGIPLYIGNNGIFSGLGFQVIELPLVPDGSAPKVLLESKE